MSERLRGKTCVLMGGGSPSIPGRVGNGQAVALTFAREGANVVVVDLDESAADETVRQIQATGRPARAMRADASKHEDVRAAIGAALSEFGRIDILYNNVGIEVTGGVLEASEESWDRVHAVNLKSVFLACKEVIPWMRQQGAGVILNVSSTASLRWTPVEYLSYSSSKAALNHVTRVIARQHASENIRCNAILPGMIDTPHVRHLYAGKSAVDLEEILRDRDRRCPMGRQGTPWEVANAALFLASDEAAYVSGVLLPVDGALSC